MRNQDSFAARVLPKSGQGAQPRAVHFFDQLHQKKWIFADRVVILQIHDDIFLRRIIHHAFQAVCGDAHVWPRAFRLRDIGANAVRAENDRGIHPLLTESDGLFTLRTVGGVRTMFTIHGNVCDRGACLFNRSAKLFKVFRIGSREVPGPGLDLVDIEFLDDMRREVFEFDGWVALFMLRPGNEFAERVGSDGDSLPRFGGKLQVWSGSGLASRSDRATLWLR